MYSNNQIFDITCALEDFPAVLAFGIKLYGDEFLIRANGRVNLAYSEPMHGIYAVGLGTMEPYETGPNKGWAKSIGKGWRDFPFEYDSDESVKIVARILTKWLFEKDPTEPKPDTDGIVECRIRVMSLHTAQKLSILPDSYEIPGWQASDAILVCAPCWIVYAK